MFRCGRYVLTDIQLGYWGTIMVMIKIQIGLGVISIPFLFMVVGMVPGVLLFLFLAIVVTCEFVASYS